MNTRLRLRRILVPRMDAPFPLWMVFPVIFAALYASHFSLLRLPYYWDEAGYYVPAAWDFFRTGSLIPITTMSNAHPPLPSVYLALWWKTIRLLTRSDAGRRPDWWLRLGCLRFGDWRSEWRDQARWLSGQSY